MATTRRLLTLVGSVFLTLFTSSAQSAETYVDLQSGSLMGMTHLSYGVRLIDRHSLQAGIGYVPELSNHAEMTMLSFRYRYDSGIRWSIGDMTINPLSLGAGLLVGNHRELFVTLPDKYPDGYYMPSALRLVFNYQTTLQVTPRWQAYLDISVIDVGMLGFIREPEFYYDNYDFLGLDGITNWGLGARYAF